MLIAITFNLEKKSMSYVLHMKMNCLRLCLKNSETAKGHM